MDYGIYTTQGKKILLGNRATVNGRDAIAYVKNALGYLYEHRDEADHHQLMLTLRSILFAVREGVF